MKVKMKSYAVFISLILLQGCEVAKDRIYGDNITKKECWFDKDDGWPDFECGVLTVPENFSKLDGRQIKLPFIIVKSEDPDLATVPLVVTGGGGPGNGLGIAEEDSYSFDSYSWIDWSYSTNQVGRDLILIDNRGVGSSVPRLACAEMRITSMSLVDKVLTPEQQIEHTKKSFSICKKSLESQGVELSQYHVVNAAKDLESLRVGLGYKQFNLYGISYGTRVALEYERLYPDSVRSMILDSVYPQAVKSYESEARYSAEAISRVLNKCKQDKQCSDNFGYNLGLRLTKFLKQLEKSPLRITITNPITYKPMDVVVTPDVFFDTIFNTIYSDAGIRYLPKFLHATFNGNSDYLEEYIRDFYVGNIVVDPIDEAAYASYTCYDEVPFNDFNKARAEIKKYPFQHYSTKLLLENAKAMCKVWNVPTANKDFKNSYKIDTPVLVYSGELDPVTPAIMAKSVVKFASQVWIVEWPNIAHGVMSVSNCSDSVAEQFLSSPTEDLFVFGCSDDKPNFRFVLK